MSDNNSDSNYDDDYSSFFDYLSSERRNGSIFVICIIVFAIIIGISISSENNKSIIISIILSISLFSIYFGIQYSDYSSFEEQYNKRQQEQEEAKRQQELEANSFCAMNPDICLHGGKCQNIGSDKQGYRCNCTAGWTGKNCNTSSDNSADIDSRCNDPVTGEKKLGMEWCDANFDGKGGKCVESTKYSIDCPVNRDGTPNFKYNEYGCDVDNEEVWCPESNVDGKGKCVVRAAGNIGEPCNVATISQDCGGRRCLDWHNGKKTCVANNNNNKVYNAKLDKCIDYNCSKYDGDIKNCSNTFYCTYNSNNDKCRVKNREHCQSKDFNRCEDDNNCVWDDSHNVCHDKKGGISIGGDCISYSRNKNVCKNALEDCKYENNTCTTNLGSNKAKDNDLIIDVYQKKTGVIASCPDKDKYKPILDQDYCILKDYTGVPIVAVVVQEPVVPVVQEPVEPVAPAEPVAPVVPEPVKPVKPVAPKEPAEPVKPVAPKTPKTPEQNAFTVGGRIKEAFTSRREGFVVGGLSEI
tara:strand:- start:3921 stop:5492 length:1572 start_codon:yes stop_codon:yes gene_type:complete